MRRVSLLLLLLLWAVAEAGVEPVTAAAVITPLPTQRCVEPIGLRPSQTNAGVGGRQRQLFFAGERHALRLEATRRLSQRLATRALALLLRDALGYARVEELPLRDAANAALRLSAHPSQSGVPETMVNIEVWVPPDKDVDDFVKECGSLSFPGRYGWFIPTHLFNASAGMGSWRFFKDPMQAQKFQLKAEDFFEVKEIASRNACSGGGGGGGCEEWMFAPPWCVADAGQLSPCAVLLAGYPEESYFVKGDIERLQLYVQVLWLGEHLANTTRKLMQTYTEHGESTSINHSLVVLVGVPDELIMAPNDEFTSVAMPLCYTKCNASQDDCLEHCNYEMQRLVKLVWPGLPSSAKPAFQVIEKMSIDHSELITEYKKYHDVQQAACSWLKHNKHVWEKWIRYSQKETLYIGGIFPISSYLYHGIVRSAQMALDSVNKNDSVLPDFNLKLKVNDGKCQADVVMKIFIDYVMTDVFRNLVGILGPACSDTVEPLAGITKHFRTVVISYSAEGSSFSDRNKYPFFFRTIGENKKFRHIYVQILKDLGWKRVAALTEDGQKYTEYVALLQDELQNAGTFVYNRKFPREREPDAMCKYLEDIKAKNLRIIIGDVNDQAARDVMCQAYRLKMTAQYGYVWFLPSWLSPDWFDTSLNSSLKDRSAYVNCTTEEMLEAINGHLQLTHAYYAPNSSIMQEGKTVGEWRKEYEKICDWYKIPTSNYAGYAYDAVWTYAYALDFLARENQTYLTDNEIHSDATTRRFVQVLEKTNFQGVSGNIQFLNGGPSRVTTIHVVQWLKNTTHIVGTFPPTDGDKWCCLNASKIVWLTPKKLKPDDGTEEPTGCVLASLAGLMNGNCEAAIIVANVIGFGLLGVFLIIGFLIVKRRYEQKVKQTENYMKAFGIDPSVASDLDKWEIPRDHVVINRKLGEGAFGTVYGGEAHFPEKGWVAVAVKTLKVGSTTEEKLDFLSEAEVMKRFEHKNVVKLLGVCTKNEPVYTVMEFMLYGDLKTFLLARRHLVNERISEETDDISSKKLTSMALDVARALSYLAELKYVHRDVASRNCLVNAVRTVKLGDFGMTRPMFENDYYKFNRKGMLPVRWMAPESLELGIFTPASDVWSFGVLLYEVITFGSFPFQGMSNNEVLEHVKAGNTLNVPVGVKPQLEALIRSCWNRDYKRRPHSSEIVEFLANNPRLISPNLDAPASAVPLDDGAGGGIHGMRRRSSAPSHDGHPGITQHSIANACRLPPLLVDGEFRTALWDNGNDTVAVGGALEPLLGPSSDTITDSLIGMSLMKCARLQPDPDEYTMQDGGNAVSVL